MTVYLRHHDWLDGEELVHQFPGLNYKAA